MMLSKTYKIDLECNNKQIHKIVFINKSQVALIASNLIYIYDLRHSLLHHQIETPS